MIKSRNHDSRFFSLYFTVNVSQNVGRKDICQAYVIKWEEVAADQGGTAAEQAVMTIAIGVNDGEIAERNEWSFIRVDILWKAVNLPNGCYCWLAAVEDILCYLRICPWGVKASQRGHCWKSNHIFDEIS